MSEEFLYLVNEDGITRLKIERNGPSGLAWRKPDEECSVVMVIVREIVDTIVRRLRSDGHRGVS
jgi:hypothetical protein